MPRDASLTGSTPTAAWANSACARRSTTCAAASRRIARRKTPTFVWSLPQDMHVAALTREGNAAIDDGNYDGFFAPYASRVRKLRHLLRRLHRRAEGPPPLRRERDRAHLRPRRLARRGRPLGPRLHALPRSGAGAAHRAPADRRCGHARQPAPEAPAFTTDITPTLYALLGHTSGRPSPIFGTPLFWPRRAPRRPRGPISGWWPRATAASTPGSTRAGQQLYIADGVALRDYVYQPRWHRPPAWRSR